MTPEKKKALELYEEHLMYVKGMTLGDANALAKEHARISCEHLIRFCHNFSAMETGSPTHNDIGYTFWQGVKQEIKNI